MQKPKNRIVIISIAIFLMLSMSASMMLVPNASAHTPAMQIPTYAYISAAPNPVGVGQTGTVFMWLNQIFGGSDYFGSALLSNNYRFHNYKLTITAPDGTTSTTTFSYISDPTSSQYTTYTPTQVGTYTFNFTFPGQAYDQFAGEYNPASVLVNDTYLPSSASTTITVQQAPIPAAIGSSPLPTAYWTRPIFGENTNWYTISSNWLGTGAPVESATGSGPISGVSYAQALTQRYPGDAVGSLTAHVMWTTPLQGGGVVGGNNFAIQGDTYFEGSAYNQRFINPIIIDGMLYYTEPVSFANTPGGNAATGYGPTVCVNLQTGQQIWNSTAIPALSFGYIYDVQDPNQHGVYPPILIAASGGVSFFGPPTPIKWQAFDAYTGDYMFTVNNIPSGEVALGVNGEYLIYVLANDGTPAAPQYYLAEWNSSNLWYGQYSGASTSPTVVPPITNGQDPHMYDWNVSIPSIDTMTSPTILAAFTGNMLLCMNGSYPVGTQSFLAAPSYAPYTYFAINLNASKGTVGSVLWTNTVQPPAGSITVSFGGADPTVNVFVENYKETMQFVGYSMTTGKQIWGPNTAQAALDYYGQEGFVASQVAYGKLYSCGMGGILYCYNLANGNLLWTTGNSGEGNSTSAGLNTPYGDYPMFLNAVGNGVIYTATSEHTVETPIYKGATARAINATTGQVIWTLPDYTGEFGAVSYAIADGYATFFNGYDNQIYVVGKGPSATTVQAPLTGIIAGDYVTVQGTVMDISAGTKQTQQAADFPNGVPVASDASMSDWMSYVYQQQPCPTNFTGAPVSIDAIDPNDNYVHIGNATTDGNGYFIYSWHTPDIPGKYAITATFAGTNGYWGSNAETGMTVQAAPSATAAPTPAPASVVDTYFVPAVIAIIVVIIIGFVFLFLALRKRP